MFTIRLLFRPYQPLCHVLTALFYLLLFHATPLLFDRARILSDSLCYTCSSLSQILFVINKKCCYKYGSVRHRNTSKREVNRIPGPDANRLSLSATPQWEFLIFRPQQTGRPCLDNWFLSSTHKATAVTEGWPQCTLRLWGLSGRCPRTTRQLELVPTYEKQTDRRTDRYTLTQIHT